MKLNTNRGKKSIKIALKSKINKIIMVAKAKKGTVRCSL